MKLKRITDIDNQLYAQLCGLYTESFPEIERRDIKQLDRLVETSDRMHFNAILEDDGRPAGLMIFWDFGKFVYLEHFAIFPHMRNGGIGKRTLDLLSSATDKPQVLEAEPADDGMAGRRIEFYRRNGFEVIEKEYEQPSYRENGEGMPLWIMSDSVFEKDMIKEIAETIKQEVYYGNYNLV